MDAEGLATPDDLVNRYAQNTTRDLSNINWYAVLACFKLGIILEGTQCPGRCGPGAQGDRRASARRHRAVVRARTRADGGRAVIDFEIPGETAALRDEIRAFVTEQIVPYETRPSASPGTARTRSCAPNWSNWPATPGC